MMPKPRIVHICTADKFIEPFINYVERHFNSSDHEFVIFGDAVKYQIQPRENVWFFQGLSKRVRLLLLMQQATKIFIHGLFGSHLVKLLAYQPWLLGRCYWIIWGADLYSYLNRPKSQSEAMYEKFRQLLIRNFGHLVTYFDEEYALAKQWYDVTGQHHKSFTYPSNIFIDNNFQLKKRGRINIQVGNSATETNRHFETLEKLARFKNEDIMIYVPLSYGKAPYAEQVAAYGRELFGDKFMPLVDFMPYDEYQQYLATIDIAIFNHNRQQGVGNIISLLGMGKTVYMNPEVTSWQALCNMGIHLRDVNMLGISKLSPMEIAENKRIITNCFSEAQLTNQLDALFRDSVSNCTEC